MTTNAGTTKKTSRKRTYRRESDDLSNSIEAFSGNDNREELIATAAYYRAEQRGFVEGGEVEDWLAAEDEIERCLATSGGKLQVGDYP